MYSWGRVTLVGSFLRPRVVHLHGVATAGAMLTCVAVVLNVGPFVKAPKIDSLPDRASRETARAATEQPVTTTSTPRFAIQPATQPDSVQLAMEESEVPEPIRPSMEPKSVVDVAHSASQLATLKEAVDVIQAEPLRQDLAAATSAVHPLAGQANSDHATPELIKKAIVGVWAPDSGTCSARSFREGVLPAVINAEGAWAGETFCVFKNKKETETGWRVVAKCSNQREHWTTNVRLSVHDNRLTWTSKRGTQIYTRCAPDVLMAEAR